MDVSNGVIVAIALLVAIQIGVQIYSLIDLIRRPVVAGGQKWIWALVILFGNLVGALIYLAVGRREPPATEPEADESTTASARSKAAADLLYGRGDRR